MNCSQIHHSSPFPILSSQSLPPITPLLPHPLPFPSLQKGADPSCISVSQNLIEEEMGNSLGCFDKGDNFLNKTPIVQALRLTVNKWNLVKLNSFCKAEDMVNKTKWQPT